jgi:outer membrane protein assembly factor BamB
MVSQGKLYFGCSDGKVCALDAATGDKEWEFETGDKIWSTPAIDGGNLYIGSFDKKLYAIDAATGEKKWEFESGGAIAVTPVINNHTVYIGSFSRSFHALNDSNGKLLWQFPVNDEVEHKPGNWFWTKPVVYNNIIYAANLDGKVYILNTKSGEEAASCVDLKRRIISSPALVDSLIVIALDDGQLWTIDTDNNEKGLLIDLGEEIYAPLCAGEGVVYIHTQKGSLYEVDTRGAKRKLYPIE